MRNNNFDFLRFYFAFIVLIGHIIVISNVSAFKVYSPYFDTYISITAFFCISGFLISSSYIRNKSVKDYFKKRAARILPAYVLVVLSCAVFFSLVSSYSFCDYFTHPQFFKYLLSNLFFLNFLEPCLPGVFTNPELIGCSVNGALWTLKIEVGFYLLVPVLFYLMNKVERKYIFLIIIYILAVLYRNAFGQLFLSTGTDMFKLLGRQLPGFMSYFTCGIALYFYFDFFIKNKKWFLLSGLLLFAFEKMMGWEILTPFALSSIVFTAAYSLKGLNKFGKYGDISYGIYIYHYPIVKLATDWGYFEHYNPYLVVLVIILIVIILAFLSWHFFERKFLKR